MTGQRTRDGPAHDHYGADRRRARQRKAEALSQIRWTPQAGERQHGADESALGEEDQPGISKSENATQSARDLPHRQMTAALELGRRKARESSVRRIVGDERPGGKPDREHAHR